MELARINTIDRTSIKTSIFKAMVLTGYNPKNMDLDSLNVIIDNLQKNEKNLTIDDFNLAFEMGVNGRLGIDLNTYQNFNALYISNVIQAFKRHNAKNHLIKPLEAPQSKELIDAPVLSKEENAKHWYDWMAQEVKESGKIPFIADWQAVYWYLDSNDLIDLDNDAKEMFFDMVKNELEHEVMDRKANNVDYKSFKDTLESESRMKRECRKRIVIKHFEK